MFEETDRLRLRADSTFIPLDGAVWLRNQRGWLTVKSAVAYAWVQRLAQLLDGTRTIGEIRAPLSPPQRRLVDELLATLWRNGFLKRVRQDDAAYGELAARFPQQLALLDHHVDDPAARLLSWQRVRIVCVGRDDELATLAGPFRENGVADVDTVAVGEADKALDDEALVDRLLDGATALVMARDVDAAPLMSAWQRACLRRAVALLPITGAGGLIVVGPIAWARGDACWECGWRRLHDHRRQRLHAPPLASPVALALAAHQLAADLFKRVTGALPSELTDRAGIVDRLTLGAELHTVSRHPHCASCVAGGEAPLGAPAAEPFGPLVDGVFGILASVDGSALPQLPVPRALAWAADPTRPGSAPAATVAAAGSHRDARAAAALAALEHYVTSLVGGAAMIGVGRDRAEAALRAILALAAPDAGADAVAMTPPDDEAARLLAAVRAAEPEAELVTAPHPFGLPWSTVRAGGRCLGRAVHTTASGAAESALFEALARSSTDAAPATIARTLAAPPDGWTAALDDTLARLRAHGIAVDLLDVDVDAALTRAGYAVVAATRAEAP